MTMQLIEKIKSRQAIVGVIGLGYVGLPLVIEFAKKGYKVYGFDIDEQKTQMLKKGESYIKHIPSASIAQISDNFYPTSDFSKLVEVDCIIVCVPTPLNKQREPDMTFVFGTAQVIAKYIRQGQLVVLESTTYPGTTDEDMRKILEKSGLKAGVDFYLAFSPEREDPGNKEFGTAKIPKVVGGLTSTCLAVAKALYDEIVVNTVPVSSTRVAEAVKLLENIYRAVNIALVNELKMLFHRMGIDVWEVIEAAKTKPFGFQAFYPGPGLGGHCIPIDPFYLTWKAREYDFSTRFIELAGEINTHMPYYVVERTIKALNERGKVINGSRILVLGLAYKKDVDDPRESPSFKLIELLESHGAIVDYNDPHIPVAPKMRRYKVAKTSVELTPENIRTYDCVIISTDHSYYDSNILEILLRNSNLIVDTRNLVERVLGKLASPKLVKA